MTVRRPLNIAIAQKLYADPIQDPTRRHCPFTDCQIPPTTSSFPRPNERATTFPIRLNTVFTFLFFHLVRAGLKPAPTT